MDHADVAPADCPTPQYHATHYYCPGCSFVAADAPVSEAEAQRGRADALHLQLGETLARLAAAEAERDRMRDAILDIDAHSTALGEDAEGFVKGGYVVSVGAMHRALGVVGHTAYKRGEHAVWLELEHGQACAGCIELKAIALEVVGATYRRAAPPKSEASEGG